MMVGMSLVGLLCAAMLPNVCHLLFDYVVSHLFGMVFLLVIINRFFPSSVFLQS